MTHTPFIRIATVQRVPVSQVIAEFCILTQMQYSDLIRKTRKKNIVKYRQMIIHYLQANSSVVGDRYWLHNQTELGLFFGGLDHSTISYSVKIVSDLRYSYKEFNDEYQAIETILNKIIDEKETNKN